LVSSEPPDLTKCAACGEPFLKDELSGLLYCVHCDLILSLMPQGRTYMLSGESGTGKSVLCYKLMDIYLRSSKPCIFMAFDEPPSQLRATLGTMVDKLEENEKKGLLTFVDCNSCMGGLVSQERYHLDSPGDLNGLAFMVSKLANEIGREVTVRVFIDSATAMFAHCESEAILKFLYSMSARLKGSGGSLFFTLGTGSVASEVQKKLEQLADGLVEFKVTETSGQITRYYRFSKVRGTMYFDTWLPFFVMDKVIHLAPPNDLKDRERFFKIFNLIAS
jgi:KaiC/GvpD/RAD55 family RecA-like ATPase